MWRCTIRAGGWSRTLAVLLVAALASGCREGREAEVARAVRSAYTLERRVLDSRGDITSRDQVVDVYRLGFSDSLASWLADLSWSARDGRVRPAGFALEPPVRVVARKLRMRDATVVFETPTPQRILWLQEAFTVAELHWEPGGWRIVRASSVAERPPELEERR